MTEKSSSVEPDSEMFIIIVVVVVAIEIPLRQKFIISIFDY